MQLLMKLGTDALFAFSCFYLASTMSSYESPWSPRLHSAHCPPCCSRPTAMKMNICCVQPMEVSNLPTFHTPSFSLLYAVQFLLVSLIFPRLLFRCCASGLYPCARYRPLQSSTLVSRYSVDTYVRHCIIATFTNIASLHGYVFLVSALLSHVP